MAFPQEMHDASLYPAWAARHGNHDDQNLNAVLRFQSVKKAGLSTGEPETGPAFLPGGAGR
jgi:hypothetical protein